MTERWHAEGNMVLDENRLTVAYVVGQEEDNSDTVLMAAAPAMAAAIRAHIDYWDAATKGWPGVNPETVEELRAVLAEATA